MLSINARRESLAPMVLKSPFLDQEYDSAEDY